MSIINVGVDSNMRRDGARNEPDFYPKFSRLGKVTSGPTLPFFRAEVDKILAACDKYPDKENAVRLLALVLPLRYSGLRLGD
jgi:hypothetical protein